MIEKNFDAGLHILGFTLLLCLITIPYNNISGIFSFYFFKYFNINLNNLQPFIFHHLCMSIEFKNLLYGNLFQPSHFKRVVSTKYPHSKALIIGKKRGGCSNPWKPHPLSNLRKMDQAFVFLIFTNSEVHAKKKYPKNK